MSTATLNKVTNINHALAEVAARAEQIKNDAPQRFPEVASIGDAVRQGDIYIQRVEPASSSQMFYQLEQDVEFPMQLADGNTKGSRHCLAHGNGVTVYKPMRMNSREMYADLAPQYGIDPAAIKGWNLESTVRNAMWAYDSKAQNNPGLPPHVMDRDANEMLAFAGPIVVLEQENTVTHPEHGDWIMPAGTYRITYQRTLTRENTVARVLD